MGNYDQRSPEAQAYRKWYYTKRWQSLRIRQLTITPLCERCESRGHIRPATVCHHKQAHKGNQALFFDPLNLASSCADCHDVDEQRIEHGGKARQQVGADGWPIE